LSLCRVAPPAGENRCAGAVLLDEAGRHARHWGASGPEQIDHWDGGIMRRFVVLIAAALMMISCSPEEEVTGSIHNK